MYICTIYVELYTCSFKKVNNLDVKNVDECMRTILKYKKIKYNENDLSYLVIAYTSIGNILKLNVLPNNKDLFGYFDNLINNNKKLFVDIHDNFINEIFNIITIKKDVLFDELLKIGAIAILKNVLKHEYINLNKIADLPINNETWNEIKCTIHMLNNKKLS